VKQAKELADMRDINENINKNYAKYMLLKEGFKKKGYIDDKATDMHSEEPQRSYISQINFSFYIN
jgi:hypothetical protein